MLLDFMARDFDVYQTTEFGIHLHVCKNNANLIVKLWEFKLHDSPLRRPPAIR